MRKPNVLPHAQKKKSVSPPLLNVDLWSTRIALLMLLQSCDASVWNWPPLPARFSRWRSAFVEVTWVHSALATTQTVSLHSTETSVWAKRFRHSPLPLPRWTWDEASHAPVHRPLCVCGSWSVVTLNARRGVWMSFIPVLPTDVHQQLCK